MQGWVEIHDGSLPVTESEAIHAAGMKLQYDRGDYVPNRPYPIEGYLPSHLLKKRTPEIWKGLLGQAWNAYKGYPK